MLVITSRRSVLCSVSRYQAGACHPPGGAGAGAAESTGGVDGVWPKQCGLISPATKNCMMSQKTPSGKYASTPVLLRPKSRATVAVVCGPILPPFLNALFQSSVLNGGNSLNGRERHEGCHPASES